MSVRRLLRSLPMRRQTVVGALVVATVLFIVYQFTFVAELSESNKPRQHHPNSLKRHVDKTDSTKQKSLGKYKLHPKDVQVLKTDGESKKSMKGESGSVLKEQQPPPARNTGKTKGVSNPDDLVHSQGKKGAGSQAGLRTTFKCVTSGKVISQSKVNDDYCDCPEDGSDEPRTNACVNGKFSCLKFIKAFPESIPSAWVNDGVCDCCDGSDEWKMRKVESALPLQLQEKVGRYLSPCPDRCPEKQNKALN
nr:uncharacterized protein LOC123746138 [Procambarus clarkii]